MQVSMRAVPTQRLLDCEVHETICQCWQFTEPRCFSHSAVGAAIWIGTGKDLPECWSKIVNTRQGFSLSHCLNDFSRKQPYRK